MALRSSVIVCAHNEAQHLAGCLHSLLAQSRIPDEILVINNASTDTTGAVAEEIPRVRVVDEPSSATSAPISQPTTSSARSGDKMR